MLVSRRVRWEELVKYGDDNVSLLKVLQHDMTSFRFNPPKLTYPLKIIENQWLEDDMFPFEMASLVGGDILIYDGVCSRRVWQHLSNGSLYSRALSRGTSILKMLRVDRGWNPTQSCGDYFINHEIRIPT